MIYKCASVESFDRLDVGVGEIAELGLLRASLSSIGDRMVGGVSLRSKRCAAAAVVVDAASNALLPAFSVSASGSSAKPMGVAGLKKQQQQQQQQYAVDKPLAGGGHHLTTCISAMRAHSPSRNRGATAPDAAFNLDFVNYNAWLEKHPSALNSFEKVAKLAKSKQVVVFLDYDGTLSPIVENPDRAFMSDEMRATVKELAACFPTAIISGRARAKVYDFVQLSELYYAGSHGMDIMGPAKSSSGYKVNGTRDKDKKGNDVVFFQPASEYLPVVDKVCSMLNEITKTIKGSRVEHNKYCVSVHFRLVKEELWEGLATKVQNVLKDYPMLRLTHGRKVLEVRPAIAWDKGKAVNYLLNSLGFSDSDDILPLYIGDDRTDEDAFQLLNGMKHGCSILVSSSPKSTKASLSLREPAEVMDFLRRLVLWKKWGPEKRNGVQNGRYFIN